MEQEIKSTCIQALEVGQRVETCEHSFADHQSHHLVCWALTLIFEKLILHFTRSLAVEC